MLHDIDLTVYENDFLGIIGPNGGGKTTLIKCILGLLKPTAGKITYNISTMGYLPQYNTIDRKALSYFARDYGLQQISIEEGGKEPSPAHLKELVDVCRQADVRVIFIQPEFDHRNAEIIAKETRTRIVPIHPLSYDWEAEMQAVARALANNDKQ